jgi:TRAP transporter TAXI family solute receptor
MKRTKKSLLASVLVGCVLVLVATSAFSGEWKVPAKWKFLRFAGGSAAGSFTPLSAKISELFNKQIPGVNASSTLGGSYSNCTKVHEGKMQIALTTNDPAVNSYYGLGRMKGKMTNKIRFLGAVHYGLYYILVRKDSDIYDISEIVKRPLRTVVGPVGSATYGFSDQLLRVYGSSIKDLEARGGTANNVYYGVGTKMMKDGQVDYLAFSTSTNASFVTDVATRPGIRFLEVTPKERKRKLMDTLPGTVEMVMPKDMYPGTDKDYNTIASSYIIIVNEDMPEELAYRITKVIWDNLKQVQAVGAFGKYIKLETAFRGMSFPIHPGAARYYKEKGMTPPQPKVPKM